MVKLKRKINSTKDQEKQNQKNWDWIEKIIYDKLGLKYEIKN
jgi:hypothetical protein